MIVTPTYHVFGMYAVHRPQRAAGRVLTAPLITAHNIFQQPHNVEPAEFGDFRLTDDGFHADLPAKSVVALEIE